MIIPARWYAGGKGLDDFRSNMLKDKHIEYLYDYPNSADCFPGVIIAGGICYFLWNKEYNGPCKITNIKGDIFSPVLTRKLDEYSIFIRDNEAINIIRKTKNVSLKSQKEIIAQGGDIKKNLRKLNIAQMSGIAYSAVMLGILLPKLNIWMTKKEVKGK